MNENNANKPNIRSSGGGFRSNLRQFNLLIWKNYSLQKRAKIGLIIELLLPAIFAIILLPIRTLVRSDQRNDTIYRLFDVNHLPFGLRPPQVKKWIFGYQPNSSDLINNLMSDLAKEKDLDIRGFHNESDMVNYLTNPLVYRTALGGASFINLDLKNFTYKLRFSYSPKNSDEPALFKKDNDWKTQFIFNLFPILGPRESGQTEGGDPGYYREGFLAIQKAIDILFISQFNPEVKSVNIFLKRFNYPPYNDDKFVVVISALFPLIIVLSFIFTVILTAKAIVHEKETGLKEAMKLMGMKPWIYWLSWYVKTLVMLMPAVIFMIISYKIQLTVEGGSKASIIDKTDPFLFAIFLILYSSCTITFTLMFTTLFKKANSAAAAAGITFFLSYIPHIFISLRYTKMSLIEKILPLFLSNLAMAEGIQLIGMFEG
jgi:ATP-binding cassette subfamily A (ABC1) protein 3